MNKIIYYIILGRNPRQVEIKHLQNTITNKISIKALHSKIRKLLTNEQFTRDLKEGRTLCP